MSTRSSTTSPTSAEGSSDTDEVRHFPGKPLQLEPTEELLKKAAHKAKKYAQERAEATKAGIAEAMKRMEAEFAKIETNPQKVDRVLNYRMDKMEEERKTVAILHDTTDFTKLFDDRKPENLKGSRSRSKETRKTCKRQKKKEKTTGVKKVSLKGKQSRTPSKEPSKEKVSKELVSKEALSKDVVSKESTPSKDAVSKESLPVTPGRLSTRESFVWTPGKISGSETFVTPVTVRKSGSVDVEMEATSDNLVKKKKKKAKKGKASPTTPASKNCGKKPWYRLFW